MVKTQNIPMYQLECLVTSKGKRFAGTKRRVKWRFGFADIASLDDGKVGADCRGEEHEVVLVMSLTSGKQLVLADGNEVHFVKGNYTDRFECSWTTEKGHEMTVVANASPSLFHRSAGRPFDLLINGKSYCQFPRMLELGRDSQNGIPSSSPRSPRRRSQEPISNAQPHSMPRRALSMPTIVPVGDLLSDTSSPSQQEVQNVPFPPATSPTTVFDFFADTYDAAPQPKLSSYHGHGDQSMSYASPWLQPQTGLVTPDSSLHGSAHFTFPQNFQAGSDHSRGMSPSSSVASDVHVEQALKSLVDLNLSNDGSNGIPHSRSEGNLSNYYSMVSPQAFNYQQPAYGMNSSAHSMPQQQSGSQSDDMFRPVYAQ